VEGGVDCVVLFAGVLFDIDLENNPFWDPCVTIVGSDQYTLSLLSLATIFNHQSIGKLIL
jgi:hypothetical protein